MLQLQGKGLQAPARLLMQLLCWRAACGCDLQLVTAPCCPLLFLQGKGLGRFLMQLLELIGRRSGVARLMLTVFHANTTAVALYKRLGWVACGGASMQSVLLLPPPLLACYRCTGGWSRCHH